MDLICSLTCRRALGRRWRMPSALSPTPTQFDVLLGFLVSVILLPLGIRVVCLGCRCGVGSLGRGHGLGLRCVRGYTTCVRTQRVDTDKRFLQGSRVKLADAVKAFVSRGQARNVCLIGVAVVIHVTYLYQLDLMRDGWLAPPELMKLDAKMLRQARPIESLEETKPEHCCSRCC